MVGATHGSDSTTIFGQPSWKIASNTVEVFVTQVGGHVGPVTFHIGDRRVAPFSVAPWAEEELAPDTPPLIRALRGDFFCMPFGANEEPFGSEQYPLHGETGNGAWLFQASLAENGRHTLRLGLDTTVRAGHVDKEITLVDGHSAVYSRHIVSGMSGPMNFGQHAMLKFPDEPGSGHLSTSAFTYGQVFPWPTELPEEQGYSILKPGARFDSLASVPTVTGETADLTRYPARRGYEDIALIASDPDVPFAWTAVAFPKEGYVWFALKDPHVLRSTLFWISNGGRYYAPWSGRHVNVMGLEEITAFFHRGVADSCTPNDLSRQGIATCAELDPAKPLVVNYIMAVAAIPDGFDRVVEITANETKDSVTLRSASGQSVTAALDVAFLAG
jgi:hypothetical protein